MSSGSGEAGVRPASTAAGGFQSLSVRVLVQARPFDVHTPAQGPDGIPDGNPEAIIVGSPLDGTKNSGTALGNVYEDISGVIAYQYGL
jgi:hypothetical protein